MLLSTIVIVVGREEQRLEFCVSRNLSCHEEISRGQREAHAKEVRRRRPGWVSRTHMGPVGPPLWPVGSSKAHGLRAKCPADFEVGGSSNG
jgi:hypothetical protein